MQTIDLEAIRNADLQTDPYPFFTNQNFLVPGAIDDLRRDFPDISKPGYLTVDETELHGRFTTLIEELEGPELTEELSSKFGQDLHPYPRLTTIMRHSALKHGVPHTDGASKVMTMLVYMNDAWEGDKAGRLRVLEDGEHFEPYVAEIPPTMGTVFAFLRRDNSWHGHRPFAGERRVVQVAWVTSQEELDRKKRRNSFAKLLKGVFGS